MLLTDDTYVYWSSTAAHHGDPTVLVPGVFRATKATAAVKQIASEAAFVLAQDATHLYFVDGFFPPARVWSCAKPDCTSKVELSLAKNAKADADAIAVDATHVYWKADNIYRCAKAGCGGVPEQVGTRTTTARSFMGLATNGTNVYWAEGKWPTDGPILRCPTAGCTGTPQLFTNIPGAWWLTIGAGRLYGATSESPTGAVFFCDLTGCPVGFSADAVAENQEGPLAPVLDGTKVYWATEHDPTTACAGWGLAKSCPNGGCTSQPASMCLDVPNSGSPSAHTVDATHVYLAAYGDSGKGTIWRHPK